MLLRALSLLSSQALASHSGIHRDTSTVTVGGSGESDLPSLHRRLKEDHVRDQGPGPGHQWG